jgi:MFS family permease
MAGFAISLAVAHLIGGTLADRWQAPRLHCLGLAGFGLSLTCLYVAQSAALAGGRSPRIRRTTSIPRWTPHS